MPWPDPFYAEIPWLLPDHHCIRRGFLQSIIATPVISRSSLTAAAVIATSLIFINFLN